MNTIAKFVTLVAISLIAFNGCKKDQTNQKDTTDGIFTDPRDNQVYPFKKIGTQVWMTKNLNYGEWPSWCYNENDDSCNKYGHLYDWNTALSVSPPGWHLPSDAEWTILTEFLGASAGGKMKSTTGWKSPNTGATNSSGFAGLPGGMRYWYGSFNDIGDIGRWWSSTENSSNNLWAWGRTLSYDNANVIRDSLFFKRNMHAVRCIRD
jgi:uncharacterized protein (TIGR02145 family)